MLNIKSIKLLAFALGSSIFLGCLGGLVAGEELSGKVVSISDGDTIGVLIGGRETRVRLHGIDCPEKSQDFGERAKKETSARVFSKIVTIRSHGNDRYGRTLGDVFYGSNSLNQELVGEGYCWWYRKYAPNNLTLKSLEESAQTQKKGLWVIPNPLPPWEFRKAEQKSSVNAEKALIVGIIIGNKQSKIYHLYSCPDHSKVSPSNLRAFASEKDALDAGYRKARNCE